MQLLIFILSTIGFVYVTNRSSLLKPFRECVSDLHKDFPNAMWFPHALITCSYCMGLWAGILMCYLTFVIENYWLQYGCIGCLSAGVGITLIQLLDRKL